MVRAGDVARFGRLLGAQGEGDGFVGRHRGARVPGGAEGGVAEPGSQLGDAALVEFLVIGLEWRADILANRIGDPKQTGGALGLVVGRGDAGEVIEVAGEMGPVDVDLA